jgi:hypothetical protein
MEPLVEQLKENKALEVTTTLESMLKQKTREAIEETRKQVAADTFGVSFESTDPKLQEAIDAAYYGKEQLDEGSEVDHPLAKELADHAVHNHEQYHQGNHDSRHGGWAMHDLHTWAKNYAKKKDKGVYDKELAVKGLTHAIRNSEASTFGQAHGTKHGQRISGATRTQAARHLLPHVEKLMPQHQKKKDVKEAEIAEKRDPFGHSKKELSQLGAMSQGIKNQVAASKPKSNFQRDLEDWRKHDRGAIPKGKLGEAEKSDVPSADEVAKHDKWAAGIRAKAAKGQGEFNKKWHAAKDDNERKALKKHAFQHDYDIPWSHSVHQSKSPIHSFATEEVKKKVNEEYLAEAIPYPAKSKHLSDYKKTDKPGVFHHPDGHRIEIDKDKGEIHHYSAGSSKPKTFKHASDLHAHLMKLHHNFDDKVKQHTIDHIHDNGYGLLHKMGKLDYAHKNHPEGRDHEEDAVNYKAMHKAAMGFQTRDRKAARKAYDAAHKDDKE